MVGVVGVVGLVGRVLGLVGRDVVRVVGAWVLRGAVVGDEVGVVGDEVC